MGLDIFVYKNIKKIDSDSESYDGFIAYVDSPNWKDRIKNLEEGARYDGDYEHADIHYPYSAHTWFRNMLASIILDKEVVRFWEEEYGEDAPFIEFIDFSDCEGVIDWETAGKLHKDFCDWEDKVMELDEDDYRRHTFKQRYIAWKNAFESAKEVNSAVVYS